jgi:hypothetical protein
MRFAAKLLKVDDRHRHYLARLRKLCTEVSYKSESLQLYRTYFGVAQCRHKEESTTTAQWSLSHAYRNYELDGMRRRP